MLRGLLELSQKSLLVSLRTFMAPKKSMPVSLPTSIWDKKSAGLASQLGGISLGMHTEGVTSARHPYTCGSIPQHNTLLHPGSTEPMLCKMGLPTSSPAAKDAALTWASPSKSDQGKKAVFLELHRHPTRENAILPLFSQHFAPRHT